MSYAYQECQVGYGRRHGGSCLLTNKKGAVNVEFKVPAKNGQKSASLKKLKIGKNWLLDDAEPQFGIWF